MKNNLKRFFATLLVLTIAVGGWAEHIAEIGFRGGASGLLYQSDYGKLMPGVNGGADLMYGYMSGVGVGIRLGVSFDYATSRFQANGFSDQYDHLSCQYASVVKYDTVSYKFDQYSEQHQQMYVSVPVQIAFRAKRWTLNVGPKLMLPLSMKYNATAKNADMHLHALYGGGNSAWIGQTSTNGEGAVPSLGAYCGDETTKGDIKSRPQFWAAVALETGYEFPSNSNTSVVLSLYGEYGVNPAKVNAASMASSLLTLVDNPEYNADPNSSTPVHLRTLNPAFESKMGDKQLVRGYNYFSAGIKLAIQFHWGRQHMPSKYKICHCTDLEF